MKNTIHIVLFILFFIILIIITIIPKLLVSLWRWESLTVVNDYTQNNYFSCVSDLVASILTLPED